MSQHRDHGPASRAAAARAVASVIGDGRSLSDAIDGALLATGGADRALCSELAYGTLRFHPRLAALAAQMLDRPLPPDAIDVEALLLVGLYQLWELKTPPHVAVTNTVEAARILGRQWACGLLNAVLRRSQREAERLQSAISRAETASHAHPQWLIDAIREAHPGQWREILEANNRRPPMTLRVNARRTRRDAYLQRLAAAGIAGKPCLYAAQGVTLEAPAAVDSLPGFADGLVSVQDEAAQLAAPLLEVTAGMRVLDACAAPGGKCAHLLESDPPPAELIAVDSAAGRLVRLERTLERLQLTATIIQGDAAEPEGWWDGRPFDRILLDAPCSATGVIRRHPDIKVLRTPRDIAALASTQQRLLAALWPMLARGGKLLYATCSVLPQENAAVVEAFVGHRTDARPLPIDATWGCVAGPGRQILPGDNGMDGFFYALLGKD
jgi:16S rRNA (cytosine967-C5)-methyltransferase